MLKRPVAFGKREPIKKLGFVIFFLTIAFALTSSVMALYINSFVHSEAKVGLTFSFFIALSFLSFFLIIPLIESSDKYKLTIKSLIFSVIGYFLYYFVGNFYVFLVLASVISIISTVRISAIGLLVRENSKRKTLSKNEGYIYSLSNLSFTIGSLLIIPLIFYFGLRSVFLAASFIILLSMLLIHFSKISHGRKKERVDGNVFKNFVAFFKDKERVKSYILRSGVTFWWSLSYVYLPLLIIKHLPEFWVGIFLSAITVPLIFLEYPFGKMAGKIGYKKFFFIGFLIPAIMSLLSFVFYQNIFFIMGSVVFASIGLAMLESNTESYFFDIAKGKEHLRFYSAHNTSLEIGHLAGQFIPALVLLFLPSKFVFLVFGLGTLLLSILALSIKNIKESKRKS
ncbi:MAG: MFS transporter [Nanoarchaeota archaeon]